ncbi:hypothetical protein [Hymenobacter cheonanensis]|uniref:hypothetical protein n=1 Tax=Hymenobacter sp. CA2-7 TaxID=3063993 RepID=UPI002712F5CE|nr:hypothetical protein [Hymenobacter sp. CA2-7]MDO7883723.1 hypothetical protein [Hymenobacter sp. CA2-7]
MPTPLRIVRHFSNAAYCITEYVPAERWLRTTWQGFISPTDAEQGARAALEPLQSGPIACLLNDNSQIQGPWFDSVGWLQRVWAPQAARLGLRYVAHVAQPHTEADLGSVLLRNPFRNLFEIQVFQTVEDAATWLRDCQPGSGRAGAADHPAAA